MTTKNATIATVAALSVSPGLVTTTISAPAKNSKPDPIDNTDLVAAFRADGGRIYHVVPDPRYPQSRGVTFAWKRKGGRIEFATAVQHRNDDFTKKMGTKTAIEHFLAGKTVFLPLRSGCKTETILNGLSLIVRYS